MPAPPQNKRDDKGDNSKGQSNVRQEPLHNPSEIKFATMHKQTKNEERDLGSPKACNAQTPCDNIGILRQPTQSTFKIKMNDSLPWVKGMRPEPVRITSSHGRRPGAPPRPQVQPIQLLKHTQVRPASAPTVPGVTWGTGALHNPPVRTAAAHRREENPALHSQGPSKKQGPISLPPGRPSHQRLMNCIL